MVSYANAARLSSRSLLAVLVLALLVIIAPPARADTPPYAVYLPYIDTRGPVFVQNESTYTAIIYRYIVGEVLNTLTVPVYNVRVSARFYSPTGQFIREVSEPAMLGRMLPGQTNPFKIIMEDSTVSPYSRFDLAVTYDTSSPITFESLEVVSAAIVSTSTFPQLVGNVRNGTDLPLTSGTIVATFYDAQGRVVEAGRDYVDQIPFVPRAQEGYEISIFNFGTVASYRVQGEARRF